MMSRKGTATAVIALCCTVAGAGLVGCEDDSKADAKPSTSASPAGATPRADDPDTFTGTRKIEIDGRSVNVSCSGGAVDGRPVVVLLSGGGDDLKKFAGIQRTLGKKGRACSYDRLGAGASDQPDGPQTLGGSGKVLTSVIEQVAGDAPVVLAGHSLGGLIAARYAPGHRDRVKGLVLMDATSPTQTADLTAGIPSRPPGRRASCVPRRWPSWKGRARRS